MVLVVFIIINIILVGIFYYLWSIGTSPYPATGYNSVLDNYNVGVNIRGTASTLNLQHNTTYYSTIIALDILGESHASPGVSSDGVTIDTTPPVPLSCTNTTYNLLSSVTILTYTQISIGQTESNEFYQMKLCVNFISFSDDSIPIQLLLQVTIDDTTQEINLVSHQHFKTDVCQIYYIPFMATSNTTLVTLNLTDPLPNRYNVTVEELNVYSCIPSTDNNSIIIHNQQSVVPNILEFSWLMVDRESGLCDYTLAIGNSPRNQQILPYTKVGVVTSFMARNLDIYHGLALYITVIGENCAGLKKVFDMQAPWLPDTTPPFVERVWDGPGDSDADATNISKIYLKFTPPVEREDTLLYCEWSVGKCINSTNAHLYTCLYFMDNLWNNFTLCA